MENVNAKAKNIAEETSGKIQLVYIHRKGIVAQDKKGNKIAFFQLGKSIEPLLHLPHEYGEGEHDPEFPNCTDTYSFFNEKFGFWVTKKDKSILWRMRTDISFVFEGHELIGMKFDDFLSLNLLQPDFIQKDYSHNIKKFLLIFTVCGNLFLLCYYKYFNFLIETLNRFSFTHFDTMKILLPLGISFFTFQQISFIYDMYKGEAKQTNIVDYTLFVLFFPQLIAGPICTFKELIPQFEDKTKKFINRENIYLGIFFISIGLFKKVILADNFTNFIQDVITMNAMTEFFTTWSFAFSVALQGYFDFSGYCDIALFKAILIFPDIVI